jgi:aminoglycoside phosphotransferase family enzyme/predicted kinase
MEYDIEGQREVYAFLADPRSHACGAEPVRRIDTHVAVVFLAGADAYKIKRAVRYPFLDFSTLEKRRRACENEIAVNQDNAPELYLGIVPIVWDGERLRIGGKGAIVEWAVHLRRFDESRTLDKVSERGELGPTVVEPLAAAILASHRRAPVSTSESAVEAFLVQNQSTLSELSETAPILEPSAVEMFRARLDVELARVGPLLRRRASNGWIRRCHGDLHLRNIVLLDERPVLFDAIEFNDAIATCDVLYDLAFLLMDLWERGLHDDASLLFNRYLWGCNDLEAQVDGLAALPAFLAIRAAVRSKVAAELARISPAENMQASADARRYFAAACTFLNPAPLRLIGIGGVSGTGKTTIARRLSPIVGPVPGAVHLRSDIERKRLLGVSEHDRLSKAGYTADVTAKTYERLRKLANRSLLARHSVIVDAMHLRRRDRDELAHTAAARAASFIRIWLEAPTDLSTSRVATRVGDASDATPAIVKNQANLLVGPNDWSCFNAAQPVNAVLRKIAETFF